MQVTELVLHIHNKQPMKAWWLLIVNIIHLQCSTISAPPPLDVTGTLSPAPSGCHRYTYISRSLEPLVTAWWQAYCKGLGMFGELSLGSFGEVHLSDLRCQLGSVYSQQCLWMLLQLHPPPPPPHRHPWVGAPGLCWTRTAQVPRPPSPAWPAAALPPLCTSAAVGWGQLYSRRGCVCVCVCVMCMGM